MAVPLTNKRCVTFTKERLPPPQMTAWREMLGVDKDCQMPWPTWGTEDAMRDHTNWSRAEGGEEELEYAPPPGAPMSGGDAPCGCRSG